MMIENVGLSLSAITWNHCIKDCIEVITSEMSNSEKYNGLSIIYDDDEVLYMIDTNTYDKACFYTFMTGIDILTIDIAKYSKLERFPYNLYKLIINLHPKKLLVNTYSLDDVTSSSSSYQLTEEGTYKPELYNLESHNELVQAVNNQLKRRKKHD